MNRRDLVLACALALLLGWLVGSVRAEDGCPGIVLTSGVVSSAEHETAEGYFVINETVLQVKPESIAKTELARMRGEVQELVIRPVRCRADVERLER